MKLILATTNPGKLREMREIFAKLPIETVSLGELEDTDKVEENGKTFLDNALIKARYFSQKYNMPSLADDGGLEIDALGGEPGVLTRRWPGYEASDEELIELALEKLKGIPYQKRTARLTTVVVIVFPDGSFLQGSSARDGIIAETPHTKRDAGYPFRSLHIIPELNKYYIELNEEEHARMNHRREALTELSEKFAAALGI